MLEKEKQTKDLLKQHFEKSEIYIFFTFLKSPLAKQFVQFKPELQPKIFILSLKDLQKNCSSLANPNFIEVIKRYGMVVETDSSNICTVTHRTLNLRSSNDQIMNIWLLGQTAHFLNNKSFVRKFYEKLNKFASKFKTIYWSSKEQFTVIKKKNYSLKQLHLLKKYGYKIVKTFSNNTILTHALLSSESSIINWIIVSKISTVQPQKQPQLTIIPTPPIDPLFLLQKSPRKQDPQCLILQKSQPTIPPTPLPIPQLLTPLPQPNSFSCTKSSIDYLLFCLKIKLSHQKARLGNFPIRSIEAKCISIIKYGEKLSSTVDGELDKQIMEFEEEIKRLKEELEHQRRMLMYLEKDLGELGRGGWVERVRFVGEEEGERF